MTLFACALVGACTGRTTLVVQVRTDLLPGRELAAVEVEVDAADGAEVGRARVESEAARDWGHGVRVAELVGIPQGAGYRVRVRALGPDGELVVERPVRVELAGGLRVVTVLLSRACQGVVCPSTGGDVDAIACLAGACVDAACTEEDPSSCAVGACASDGDCPVGRGACAAVECTASGVCALVPDHAACAASEVCDVDVGCEPATCAAFAYGDPRPIDGPVNTATEQWSPALSADGLELFYMDRAPGSFDLFVARRADRGRPFETVERLDVLSSVADDIDPSISRDGRTLYFASRRTGAMRIHVARRAGPGQPFDPPELIDVGPGGTDVLGPDVSADELELFFTADVRGFFRVYGASRAGLDEPFSGPGPRLDPEPALIAAWPGVTPDALALYYEERSGAEGTEVIREATRSARDDPFTPGAVLDVLGVGAGDPDPSWDGRELYYAARVSDTDADLFVARRVCVP